MSRADLNGLTDQGKGAGLGFLLWLRGRLRVTVPMAGRGAKEGAHGLSVSLSICEAEGKQGGVRLKSCQESKIKKWILTIRV